MYKTPILFIIFNRINETKRVFSKIREQKPVKLFLAADGPRNTVEGEKQVCDNVRAWVLNSIDWDCEVKTLFRDENLGCGTNEYLAMTLFFEEVEEGLVIEDDTLPNDTFFRFCQDLLEEYRYNHKISIISGNNFQPAQPMPIHEDYYFSIFPSTWGWASWRRSWEGYKFFVSENSDANDTSFIQKNFKEKEYQNWWKTQYYHFHDNKPVNTWDFQFYFHCMRRNQLAIVPKVNLISNIGHGPEGTNTKDSNSHLANMTTFELTFPLIHPAVITRNYEADVFNQNLLFGRVEEEAYLKKLKRLVKRIFN